MKANRPLPQVVSALFDPAVTLGYSLRAWNELLLVAREQGLLARFGYGLAQGELLNGVPSKAQAHLRAACIAAESTQTAVRFEINRILRALSGVAVPVVLLKGAAYVMADLPPARGRLVGDVDLMVPRDRIGDVERALGAGGWVPAEMNEYDQRYYREWMHEIPPLEYPDRETPVDIHHTIVPVMSRTKVDAAALLAASVPLADPRLRVLGPADMVLHSAVHLFNTQVGKPLRDLFDLHDLLSHFGARPAFWQELLSRAGLHALTRPLYYALRYTRCLLGTPVPPEVERAAAAGAPGAALRPLMDGLFAALLVPEPPERKRAVAAFARGILYCRTHWLSMPPAMLVRHLAIKSLRRVSEGSERKRKDPGA